MKKMILFMFCVLIVPMLMSCVTTAGPVTAGSAAQAGDINFNDITGIEWTLSELRRGGNIVQIDREWLEANYIGNWFTISFEDDRVFGTGAPNRFSGPTTAGNGQALGIGLLASTLMASFIELEALSEHDFYTYLHNVTRWNLRGGQLELFSTSGGGQEAVLVFTAL